jgi:hypothetical protein
VSDELEFRGHHTYFGEMPRRRVPEALINRGRILFSFLIGDGLLTRTIHEHVTNSPPFGLRPAPLGRLLRISPG